MKGVPSSSLNVRRTRGIGIVVRILTNSNVEASRSGAPKLEVAFTRVSSLIPLVTLDGLRQSAGSEQSPSFDQSHPFTVQKRLEFKLEMPTSLAETLLQIGKYSRLFHNAYGQDPPSLCVIKLPCCKQGLLSASFHLSWYRS
jgi:hypothetical protein